ncbi:hypothetical protein [Oceanibaculum pacificum]|uniref:hypothetical protein n=1 Tax=Oceanibaculum pacificum TaxID=580166 RepID=UPI0018DEB137|nr:hypothetical protein [Oceanibaculum pacificum]
MAAQAPAEITPELIEMMRDIAAHPVVLISVRAQNERHKDIPQAQIDALDKQWVEQRKSDNQPLIAQIMGAPLSSYLIRKMAESRGLFIEMFVMDNKGLNVGQSSITGDFWQGDEGKYQKTFLVGPDAVFIDEITVDKKTGMQSQQVNFTLIDPDTKQPIGAMTVEVDLGQLALRKQLAAR